MRWVRLDEAVLMKNAEAALCEAKIAGKNGVFLAVILPDPLVNSPAPQEVEVLACNALICKTFKVTEVKGNLFEAKDFKFLDDKIFSFYVIDYEKINVSKKKFIFEFDASMMTVRLR